jgi:protein-tyrosine kinase
VASFDWVIIDTPPVGILADANLLGSIVDAAILVVRAGQTPAADVQRAANALGRERILGVVLNRAEQARTTAEAEAYYYANSYSAPRRG